MAAHRFNIASVKLIFPPLALSSCIFWAASIILLLPWIYIQHQSSINSDTAWLSICASRLLDGGSIVHDCFDSNPPLSILVYTPFIWLSRLLRIADYHVIFWLSLVFIIFATIATRQILNSFNFLNTHEKNIFALIFLCSLTIIPTLYYAERDHFLAIMLMPLILVQLAITNKHKPPNNIITYIILVLGSITLLIKPPFGLIPAFLFLHRMIKQKRFWGVLKDIDFLILSASTVGYIIIIAVYFREFANVIFPDIVLLYLPYKDYNGTITSLIPMLEMFIICFVGIIFLPKEQKNKQSFFTLIGICVSLSLIAYFIQMKGMTYQRLPIYALLFPLSGTLIFSLLKNIINIKILLPVFISTIFALSYSFSPLRPNYPTHERYINNPVAEYMNEHCDQPPCSFYMNYENMDIVAQIAFYSDYFYASRFIVLWPLAGLYTGSVNLSEQKGEAAIKRYANYLAEDIVRFSPRLLFILDQSSDTKEGNDEPSLLELFSISPEFTNAVSNYKKIDTLNVNRAYFYKNTPYDFPYIIKWDVYKRTEAQ